jgi:hypothetical protein
MLTNTWLQVERLMQQLDEKDRELMALEESLRMLAPEGPDGSRQTRVDLSAPEEQKLQSWLSIGRGNGRQEERVKCDLPPVL